MVAADGRIGLVSWSDASSEAKPLIVKFGGPATLTEVRIGRIIAWSNHDHLQVALDEHGKLLVTLPERLSARIAEIPDFPTSLGNVSIALLSDEEDVGTLVTVGGTVNGEPWMWKGRLP